jgi:hypothetical protein
MSGQSPLVIRRNDDPANPIAGETQLSRATELAVREARQSPGVIVEVVEWETGRVLLRVRLEADNRTLLAQRPYLSAGDAWPDPPAWLPLQATA